MPTVAEIISDMLACDADRLGLTEALPAWCAQLRAAMADPGALDLIIRDFSRQQRANDEGATQPYIDALRVSDDLELAGTGYAAKADLGC